MRSFVSRFSIISCCTCWFVLDIWSRVACLFEFDGEKVLLIKQIWKYLIFFWSSPEHFIKNMFENVCWSSIF